MEFRILGPLEVVRDGKPLVMGAAKPRALLALLLLHADEVVSSDRLIDGLWGEEAPATAQKALQVYVSQLRKTLDPEILVTQPPGYVLRPGRLDLRDFEEMLRRGQAARSEGDPEAASRELGAALALWRGPPLSGLEFEPFAPAEIARLEELRLTALEDRIDADLELGAHGELVAELERLVTDNPVRERLARQLMLALYRSGRQTESLEAFRRTREGLLELGLEPSRSLRDLERAILNQDPALDASDRTEPEPAVGADQFVGRDEELGRPTCGGRPRSRGTQQRVPAGRRAGDRQEPPGRRGRSARRGPRGDRPLGPRLGGGRRAGVLGLGPGAALLRPGRRSRHASPAAGPGRAGDRPDASRASRGPPRPGRADGARVRGGALSPVRRRGLVSARGGGDAAAGADLRRPPRRRHAVAAAAAVRGARARPRAHRRDRHLPRRRARARRSPHGHAGGARARAGDPPDRAPGPAPGRRRAHHPLDDGARSTAGPDRSDPCGDRGQSPVRHRGRSPPRV